MLGLGNARAIRSVSKVLRKHNPQVVFFMKTKKTSAEFDWLGVTFGFGNCFSVGSIGRIEGLALLLQDDIDIEIFSYSQNHIDSKVNDAWRMTGFYRNLDANCHMDSCKLLCCLSSLDRLLRLYG